MRTAIKGQRVEITAGEHSGTKATVIRGANCYQGQGVATVKVGRVKTVRVSVRSIREVATRR